MSKPNKTILVVEDDVSLLNALTSKLRGEGFEVLEAKNGQVGLDLALKEHPDLMLLDVVMPRMDGISVMKELRQDEWAKDLPVIVLTNLSYAKDTLKEIEASGYDFLVKTDWKLSEVVVKVKEKLNIK